MAIKKFEIRISKSETISNDQNSNDPNNDVQIIHDVVLFVLNIRIFDLEFVSSFGFRASDL